jgi:hypothetical protein
VNPFNQRGNIMREGAAERQADSVWKVARPTTPLRRKPQRASTAGECGEVRGECSGGTESQERRQHEIRLSRRRGEKTPERLKKPGRGA